MAFTDLNSEAAYRSDLFFTSASRIRYAREYMDAENPENPEIAQDWDENGFGRQDAYDWLDVGATPSEAAAWSAEGFGPADYQIWGAIVGSDQPEVARELDAQYAPEDLVGLSYQEVMELVGDDSVPEN